METRYELDLSKSTKVDDVKRDKSKGAKGHHNKLSDRWSGLPASLQKENDKTFVKKLSDKQKKEDKMESNLMWKIRQKCSRRRDELREEGATGQKPSLTNLEKFGTYVKNRPGNCPNLGGHDFEELVVHSQRKTAD